MSLKEFEKNIANETTVTGTERNITDHIRRSIEVPLNNQDQFRASKATKKLKRDEEDHVLFAMTIRTI